jgi:serine/threonine-protein kinase RsbT
MMQNQTLETRVDVRSTIDIVTARQQGRELALKLGFSVAEVTLIAAAISEVARNMVDHAKGGEVLLSVVQEDGHRGVQVVARDEGPGIADIAQAMQYGYSTRKGLGVGLPGAKWLMDEFEINSKAGKGTTITMRKWMKNESQNLQPRH